ncbi:heat-shock protein [Methanosarcina sp.]|uniref:heat-shock protein n=1 Tax=Methanosarcina sp. TaxID=2213 RepID=UPI0029880DFF|nr:heat-shock protein [Methanosarcina sp.]MDW5551146.1 heat-shock protein [Methanosarcina sp.]MDW5552823.1 heat-shock protein [Methanosarcina sp.]MDW5558162.1 heat-shock protein [Methanosarcina sp.]
MLKNTKVPGNINSINSNSQSIFENPFVKTLAIAVFMGIFMVDMSLGLFEIFSTKESPLPLALVLLIFAVMFIAGMVFYEKHGLDTISSLVGGALAGFGFSFMFVSLIGGVQFALGGGISAIGWDQVISAVAASMIASVVMLKTLFYKLQNHSY